MNMGLQLFDELNRANAAYCRAIGRDSTPYETPLSDAELNVAAFLSSGINRRSADMFAALNGPAIPIVWNPRHPAPTEFRAVVEYAVRSPEQLAESERLAAASIQSFYDACRRRTVAPFFVGD